jgi:hypothetical protein
MEKKCSSGKSASKGRLSAPFGRSKMNSARDEDFLLLGVKNHKSKS